MPRPTPAITWRQVLDYHASDTLAQVPWRTLPPPGRKTTRAASRRKSRRRMDALETAKRSGIVGSQVWRRTASRSGQMFICDDRRQFDKAADCPPSGGSADQQSQRQRFLFSVSAYRQICRDTILCGRGRRVNTLTTDSGQFCFASSSRATNTALLTGTVSLRRARASISPARLQEIPPPPCRNPPETTPATLTLTLTLTLITSLNSNPNRKLVFLGGGVL